ncbi:putative polarized growth protein (Boi2) [Aspergillus melleus]|uniref:putative polarized growth protein (Boi2) n=1 Tax=Aspergillus melleus TaxID=138277 RepID=UPI001E8EA7FF|nr:polar growth protein [Aspergillus melleus]KAH8423199.1 polar growth protein [Aspergillus melleus]
MALTSPPRGVHPGDLLLVVHDFDARGSDELTLRRGEKIELVELDDGFGDGWYLGKELKDGTVGLFPGVYTTTAPKIPTRPQKDTPETDDPARLESEKDKSDHLTPNATAALSSPKSGESTPHVSRHASLSDMRSSDQDSESAAPSSNPSPSQPQRSSSSPLPSSKLALDLHHSLRQSIDGHLNGQTKDSPVMNETLSVIDEHITDLSTPRHSMAITQEPKSINDSASEYSSTLDHRMSYINGQETDEEEESHPTEAEVRHWSQSYTAKHLRDLGVDARHCDIFEEQEITGDVLLDMNQDFLFMKEFDFGVMGRRLKTWHKIKAFQEEVKGTSLTQSRKTSRGSGSGFATPDERTLSRAGHPAPFLPRIPNLRGSTGSAQQHPRLVSSSNMPSNASSPLTPQTPGTWMDHSRRPSAASIREINHSRRHSSIDATNRHSGAGDSPPQPGHQGKGSFDRAWTMSGGSQRRPGTAAAVTNDPVLPQHVFRGPESNNGSDSAVAVADDLDRGYFSGPDGDPRRTKRLQKRTSVRSGSFNSGPTSLADLNVKKRHSRIGSAESIRDANPRASTTAKPVATTPPKSRIRSLSQRFSERPSQQASQAAGEEKPTTNSGGFFSSFAPLVNRHDSDPVPRSTPVPLQQQIKNAGRKFPRAVGLRAMSDVVGKGIDTSVPPASPVRDADPSSARTGSTTPSTTKSSERHSTDGSNKAAEGSISLPRTRTVKSGVKSKKDTSAYTRGLEKKTPQEQMQGCEFSGWMKKRSSNIMTTWKPRLFVLRGRRLSYYYSENDTEERGLIDITAHRVLRADNDHIVALHATITGATASPTSPANSAAGDLASSDKASGSESSLRGPRNGGEGPFFFKLVPPKTGTSRTVQFTKPAIHYFQVDSAKEGRLWMAALMKATIERDMETPVETTNKQRTISLKEARLMNQRPPELTPPNQAGEEKVEPLSPAEEGGEAAANGLGLDETSQPNGEDAEEKRSSNPLGGLDTGPSSLLPESVAKPE